MIKTVTVNAPGKINLALDITGARENGYHDLNSVMQTIDLCDTITVSRARGSEILISCDHPRIPCDETNLAHIAARRFLDAFQIPETGVVIDIQKRIPLQAGLAGGSADAAGVLTALNVLFDVGAPAARLHALGVQVGADVPFCLTGGTCLAQGIGEELTALPAMPKCHILIAKPAAGISTAEAYRRYDGQGAANRPDIPYLTRQLHTGNLRELASGMYNVLEECASLDDVPFLRGKMITGGALGAMMSGSGSAVFGLFDSRSLAKHCMHKLYGLAQGVFLTRPTNRGASVLEVRERT